MKKLNQKGIGHHLLLIVLAVVVLGAAGFAGWRVYQGKNMDAQAASWTNLRVQFRDERGLSDRSPKPIMRACKQFVDAGSFGKYWRIDGLVTNGGMTNQESYKVVLSAKANMPNDSKPSFAFPNIGKVGSVYVAYTPNATFDLLYGYKISPNSSMYYFTGSVISNQGNGNAISGLGLC